MRRAAGRRWSPAVRRCWRVIGAVAALRLEPDAGTDQLVDSDSAASARPRTSSEQLRRRRGRRPRQGRPRAAGAHLRPRHAALARGLPVGQRRRAARCSPTSPRPSPARRSPRRSRRRRCSGGATFLNQSAIQATETARGRRRRRRCGRRGPPAVAAALERAPSRASSDGRSSARRPRPPAQEVLTALPAADPPARDRLRPDRAARGSTTRPSSARSSSTRPRRASRSRASRSSGRAPTSAQILVRLRPDLSEAERSEAIDLIRDAVGDPALRDPRRRVRGQRRAGGRRRARRGALERDRRAAGRRAGRDDADPGAGLRPAAAAAAARRSRWSRRRSPSACWRVRRLADDGLDRRAADPDRARGRLRDPVPGALRRGVAAAGSRRPAGRGRGGGARRARDRAPRRSRPPPGSCVLLLSPIPMVRGFGLLLVARGRDRLRARAHRGARGCSRCTGAPRRRGAGGGARARGATAGRGVAARRRRAAAVAGRARDRPPGARGLGRRAGPGARGRARARRRRLGRGHPDRGRSPTCASWSPATCPSSRTSTSSRRRPASRARSRSSVARRRPHRPGGGRLDGDFKQRVLARAGLRRRGPSCARAGRPALPVDRPLRPLRRASRPTQRAGRGRSSTCCPPYFSPAFVSRDPRTRPRRHRRDRVRDQGDAVRRAEGADRRDPRRDRPARDRERPAGRASAPRSSACRCWPPTRTRRSSSNRYLLTLAGLARGRPGAARRLPLRRAGRWCR